MTWSAGGPFGAARARHLHAPLGLIVAVILAGCGASATLTPVTARTPAPAGSPDPPAPAPTPGTGGPTAAPTPGEAGLLGDPAIGLRSLSAYRAELVQDVAGTQDGQAVERHTRIVYARDATGNEEWVQTSQQPGMPEFVRHIIRLDGARYVVDATGCSGTAIDDAVATTGDAPRDGDVPAALLIPIDQAAVVGGESINGIATTHRRFDAAGLRIDPASVGTNTVAGDVWIADSGGFVVRYQLDVAPSATTAGSDAAVRQSWRYDLRTGADAVVALPGGCLPVPVDIPAMDDATDVTRTSAGLTYRSASAADALIGFYWSRLASAGWALPTSRPPAQSELPFGLSARKDSRLLSVMLAVADGGGIEVTAVALDLSSAGAATPTAEPSGSASPAPVGTPEATPAHALPNGIPIYPGATGVLQAGPNGIIATTVDDPAKVVAWYRGALKKAGWTLDSSTAAAGIVFARWTKGAAAAMVVAQPENGSTRLVVTVE